MSQSEFNKTEANMSQEDRCVYYAYLRAKNPPKSCRLSRKKLKYKQRMRLRQERGDKVLAYMKWVDIMNAHQVAENVWDPETDHIKSKVPTVQELLNSPLSKFIELTANDCGYQVITQEII